MRNKTSWGAVSAATALLGIAIPLVGAPSWVGFVLIGLAVVILLLSVTRDKPANIEGPTEDLPSLEDIRRWGAFIKDYRLQATAPFGHVNLLSEIAYGEMEVHLSESTRKALEDIDGMALVTDSITGQSEHLKSLILRDLGRLRQHVFKVNRYSGRSPTQASNNSGWKD